MFTGGTFIWSSKPGGSGGSPGTIPAPATTLSLTPANPGNFTVAHGLGTTPILGVIQMTSGGEIYWQTVTWDGTNVYLTASDGGITANLLLWI